MSSFVVTATRLNLRRTPVIARDNIIALLPLDKEVELLDSSAGAFWRIKTAGASPLTGYAAARFLATLAWQMLGTGVGWQVYALTGDPLALGFVGLAQFLPFIALVLPAGQLADHADRRRVLMGAYATEALAATVLLAFAVPLTVVAAVRVVLPAAGAVSRGASGTACATVTE